MRKHRIDAIRNVQLIWEKNTRSRVHRAESIRIVRNGKSLGVIFWFDAMY
jgi:hypothetical protein